MTVDRLWKSGVTVLACGGLAIFGTLQGAPDFAFDLSPHSPAAAAQIGVPSSPSEEGGVVGLGVGHQTDIWIAPNQNVDVAVWAGRDRMSTVRGVRFGLTFDPSRIDVVRVTPGDFKPIQDVTVLTPVPQAWSVDHANGRVSIGEVDVQGVDRLVSGAFGVGKVRVRTRDKEGDATLQTTTPELVVLRGFDALLRVPVDSGSLTVHVDRRGMCGADQTDTTGYTGNVFRQAWLSSPTSSAEESGALGAATVWLQPDEEARLPVAVVRTNAPARYISFGLVADVPEGSEPGAITIERVEVDPCAGAIAAAAGARLDVTPWTVLPNGQGVSEGAIHIVGGASDAGLWSGTEVVALVVRARHPGRVDLRFTPEVGSARSDLESLSLAMLAQTAGRASTPISLGVGEGPPSFEFEHLPPAESSTVPFQSDQTRRAAVAAQQQATATRVALKTAVARDPASYPPTAAPVATVPVPLETPGALATALAKESTQSPAGASRISFEPTSAQLRPGQSATIDVVLDVDPAFVARGAQFGLRFDPNLVAIDKVEPATFFSDWADNHQASWAVLPQWEIYSDTGEVSIAGVVLLGGDRAAPSPAVGPTGAGSLARVYLHALSPGTTHLAILNAVLAVPSVSPFPPAGDIARSAPLATEDAEIVIDNPE